MSPTPVRLPVAGPLETYLSDRRSHKRYPITLDVEYKLLDERLVQRQGFCKTIDISSGGVLLALEDPPNLRSIELTINWPFLLRGSVPLSLKVWGKIIRSDGYRVAVRIGKHEFHTASTLKNAAHP